MSKPKKIVDSYKKNRDENDVYAKYAAPPHTPHELAMMRSALMTAVDVLAQVESEFGYHL